MVFLLLVLFRATEIYIMFQTKLSEERSSLQTAVNVLTCKLESCHKKLEAREQEIGELRCQTMECCNALEVTHTHTQTHRHTHTHTDFCSVVDSMYTHWSPGLEKNYQNCL